MSTLAEDKLKVPKSPNILYFVVIFLELAIAATFIRYRSLVGVALCLLYFWFSATFDAIFRKHDF